MIARPVISNDAAICRRWPNQTAELVMPTAEINLLHSIQLWPTSAIAGGQGHVQQKVNPEPSEALALAILVLPLNPIISYRRLQNRQRAYREKDNAIIVGAGKLPIRTVCAWRCSGSGKTRLASRGRPPGEHSRHWQSRSDRATCNRRRRVIDAACSTLAGCCWNAGARRQAGR